MKSAKLWSALGIIVVCLMIPHLYLWLLGAISARVFAGVAVAVVAAVHVYFGLLEGTQWNRPSSLGIHHLEEKVQDKDQTVADRTVPLGRNMGLYNLIFAVLLIGSLFLGRLDAFRTQAVLLSLIVVAGVIGTLTIGSPKIVIVQSLPAALALTALILGRPGTMSEQEATLRIIETEKDLLKLKYPEGKSTTLRGQHPKPVGFVVANLVVDNDLDKNLRFGVFRVPGSRHEAVIRFSNARVMNDSDPGGHGMAIKLFGIEGDKLMPEASETKTQDFLLFDNPSFFIRDAFDYVDFEAAQYWASDKHSEEADKRGEVSKAWLAVAVAYPNLASLGKLSFVIQKKPAANPLGAIYWSVVPYRLGPHAVKFRVVPVGDSVPPKPGALEDSINDVLKESLNSRPEKSWKFRFEAQLQVNPDLMPIEDATVEWSEKLSKFVPLATIEIHPERSRARFGEQLGLNIPTPTKTSETLSFSPWHGLVEHEPIGGINRVRRQVYVELSALRHERNHEPMVEPDTNEAGAK